jgi:hypothetical protein
MTADNTKQKGACEAPGLTRREAVQRVMALMGGLTLVGEERLFALSVDTASLAQATTHGVGAFTAADVALLDEIADTILPETSTPGAKAARTGAFMALMVTDAYTDRDQQVFRDGLRTLEDTCRTATGKGFMEATGPQRLTLLERLDREQKTAMEERRRPIRTRFPAAAPPAEDEPAHYFRMMKELALLGYFTSEIGYTQAMRYREAPGRFDPDVPHKPGETSWAPHA